jgi:hypothetical protein
MLTKKFFILIFTVTICLFTVNAMAEPSMFIFILKIY